MGWGGVNRHYVSPLSGRCMAIQAVMVLYLYTITRAWQNLLCTVCVVQVYASIFCVPDIQNPLDSVDLIVAGAALVSFPEPHLKELPTQYA